MAKLFHVSSDFILGLDDTPQVSLAGLNDREIHLLYELLDCFHAADGEA